LIWASLDALSSIWSKHLGKDQCENKSKRLIYDEFLAHYGGEVFQVVSLPDVWKRVDLRNTRTNQKNTSELPDDVFKFLENVGNRQAPSEINSRQNRTYSDDWSLDMIVAASKKHTGIDSKNLKNWLKFSRYGSIAYTTMRCAYIHEGRPGNNTHSFHLSGTTIQPTYQSGLYNVPSTIGFSVQFMLNTLEHCINEFEAEAFRLMEDPCPT
jgi:hypothetical protein